MEYKHNSYDGHKKNIGFEYYVKIKNLSLGKRDLNEVLNKFIITYSDNNLKERMYLSNNKFNMSSFSVVDGVLYDGEISVRDLIENIEYIKYIVKTDDVRVHKISVNFDISALKIDKQNIVRKIENASEKVKEVEKVDEKEAKVFNAKVECSFDESVHVIENISQNINIYFPKCIIVVHIH